MEITEFILLLFAFLLIFTIIYFLMNNQNKKPIINSGCNVKSCGALDPVSNPAYNMQQIVEQSILLEEHITNKNKRCRDCITKHFLHIIGLAEEAQIS